MPAGSSEPARYPSIASWELIVRSLADRFPEAVFCLVGKLERDGRTATAATRAGFERIAAAAPRAVFALDVPLVEQLAYVENLRSSSRRTRASRWPRFRSGRRGWRSPVGRGTMFSNAVPFYSVVPDTRRYPAFTQFAPQPDPVEDDGQRTPSMSRARIEEDLPELLEGARLLVEGGLGYEDALRRYFARLLAAYGGDASRIFSFDGINHSYIREAPAVAVEIDLSGRVALVTGGRAGSAGQTR